MAPQLAEIGVMLLMFGVGLHFQLKDLLAVKSIAIPGTYAMMNTTGKRSASMRRAPACLRMDAGTVRLIAKAAIITVTTPTRSASRSALAVVRYAWDDASRRRIT